MIHYGITSCTLGWLIAGWSEQGLCAIELGDSEEQLVALLSAHFPDQTCMPAGTESAESLARISQFIDAPAGTLDYRLAPEGTAFQREVWTLLQTIPPGQTVSYSELANTLGRPEAVRAVASACGANKLAVIIPCHRVVRADGGLGGYRWGIERKQALLNRESTLATNAS
ncbi:methylated-DNA--[protein]-cysteine S-methyltransferase [Marinobacter sp. SS5-14b]|uniref:methylated-DNA--[protein]-cysteine S-methyltransferase n=1 Tax=Marinobacter sp. SS5-14b TaxID=3050456 RepID=UPI0026DF9CB0|nr:methylated-DNA--[protein]-cysteine S-methyltransferase [Marinobacter sp. SS5-14b]